MDRPPDDGQIRYARSGDVNIAYRAFGSGDVDLVFVPGFISHLEIGGELPQLQRMSGRMASFAENHPPLTQNTTPAPLAFAWSFGRKTSIVRAVPYFRP